MSQLILKKLTIGMLTLFVVVSLTFFMLRLVPGGPFDQERKLPPAVQANMEAKFHLNEPLGVQYVLYLGNIVHGDFGPSYKYLTRSVNDIIAEGFWVSLRLGTLALLLGVGLGVVLGTYAGCTPSRWLDGVLSGVGMSAISMPSFIFGAMLVMLFAYHWNWLPAARLVTPAHYVLPVLILAEDFI